jgi:hypothetical protein
MSGKTKTYTIEDEKILDTYFRWGLLTDWENEDTWVDLMYDGETIARERSEAGSITNNLPPEWRRI